MDDLRKDNKSENYNHDDMITIDVSEQEHTYEHNQEEHQKIEEQETVKKSFLTKRFFVEIGIYIILLFACLNIVPKYVIQRTIVDGPSMKNTLQDGDNLLVEKLSVRFGGLERFDVIVFYPYGKEHEDYYIKRIIGMPGETIQIIGSDIYINGEILKENFGKNPITYAGIAAEPLVIGEDEYFVMGDNRKISKDSRYEEVGVVKRENIGGKAIVRIWPLNEFGFFD